MTLRLRPSRHAARWVGGTIFGRAVGSIFIGLHHQHVPRRLFPSFGEALARVREVKTP